MSDVRVVPLPAGEARVETGAVQFGNDWPGLFIRGDNAFGLALEIQSILSWYEKLPAEAKSIDGHGVFLEMESIRSLAAVIHGEVVVKPKQPGG